MLAIPNEHLLKFHACKDANSLWEAIKNRFRGNKESKKMQKTILKQNYENFVASSQEGLDKTYDSTNEMVNTAHNVFDASSKDQASTASYADGVMFYFFPYQSNAPQLDNEDLEQIDADDLEEMDLKWTNVECYNCHRRGHFARECRAPRNKGNRNRDAPRRNAPVDTSTTNALVVQDGIGSSSSDSESEVIHSVLNSRESNVDDNPVNDRFKTGEGFHAVPHPYTRNYMPPRPDLSFAGLDESVFKFAVRKTTTSALETKTSISKTSKDIVEKPKTVSLCPNIKNGTLIMK
ncbi:ribonuclease H-like domain-containing protein [Tanacetum coccineum]